VFFKNIYTCNFILKQEQFITVTNRKEEEEGKKDKLVLSHN